jgi:hypothetical protein
MWHKILTSLLLAAVTQSQMMAVTGISQTPAAQIPSANQTQLEAAPPPPVPVARIFPDANGESPVPATTSFQRYDRLRQGREEEIAVLLCRPMQSHSFCPLIPASPQAGLVPVTLELKPEAGFTVRYRRGGKFLVQQRGAAVQTSRGLAFRLKVRAETNAPLGEHRLEGKLTFRSVNLDGIWETGQVDVVIPITVVEHDAHVLDRSEHEARRFFLALLTSPIWVPILLLWVVTCEIDPDDCH